MNEPLTDEDKNATAPSETFWSRFAHRCSGRGRLRTVVIIVTLIFSSPNPISAGVGLIIFFSGLFLHFVSKGNLVRNSQLCKDGPYGWIRHPFYLSNFLIDIGICLGAGVPWLALGYLALFPLAYLPRILAEEESLRRRFPEPYDHYCRQVPRIIPNSLPPLFSWLSAISYENLRQENELSRLLRLLSYPFAILAVLLAKMSYVGHFSEPAIIVATAGMAFGFWFSGQIVHTHTEDGLPVGDAPRFVVLRRLWWVLPLLPCLNDRLPLSSWLRLRGSYETHLWIAGAIIVICGAIVAMNTRDKGHGRSYGLVLALLAFGVVVIAQQIALAPLSALAIWIAWYYSAIQSSSEPAIVYFAALPIPEIGVGRFPGFSIFATLTVTTLHEVYGLC